MSEKGKKPPYRNLNIKERDMLFALYEKHNGNLSQMVLDKDCIYKGYSTIHYYKHLYHFQERLVEKKRENAERIMSQLKDGKVKALENALRILQPNHSLVYNKSGMQIFDEHGEPLIVEKLPYYKEIKTAWEIIKAELGEPTTFQKQDLKHSGELNITDATFPEDQAALAEYHQKRKENMMKRAEEEAKEKGEI